MVLVIFLLTALTSVVLSVTRDVSHYNNFMIFRGVADHLFSSLPLYGEYPGEYLDVNHYGPLFGFVIAPFAFLPPWLGVLLWVMGMTLFLYWAIRELPLPVQMASLVLLLTANDLYNAGLMQQFNIASAAMLIGALAMIRKRHEGWAALFIVIGTFVKVYGIVGLAFFFFVERKWRFVGYMALWSVVALLLPLLFVSPEYLISQYMMWAQDITQKSAQNMWSLYQNVSVVGAVRKISGSATYSDMWIVLPAVLLFISTQFRFSQVRRAGYQLVSLASLLLFVVIFSNGSENSGYVIATAGAAIWWVTLPRRGWVEWTLFILMLIACFSYNLFPREVYVDVIRKYALRAVPYGFVWMHCIWRLWQEDFRERIE